jgi:hypothetical protein
MVLLVQQAQAELAEVAVVVTACLVAWVALEPYFFTTDS